MAKIIVLAYALLLSLLSFAQKKNASYQLHIYPTTETIRIDGIADEGVWQQAQVARNFFMVLPMDTSLAKVRTEVQMTFDKNNLYLLAKCFDAPRKTEFVESLRRDFSFGKNDNFLVFIDPFDSQTDGFAFGTNPENAQWDGLMYEGASVDLNWDNKWHSAVKHYADRWDLEMAIPLKTLRYKKGVTEWGINFSRNDLRTTEKSSWAPVPRQFPTASLAYTGTLVWENSPTIQKGNISLIPHILTGLTKEYKPSYPSDFKREAGLDAKVAITSSLNLDLTVNPDFSQVEVDKQVTNLDRYELFFPERRQFFLENGDQINNFGYPGIRPFFSRRIGLGIPINYGGRLSGSLNNKWRLTLLNMGTAKQEDIGLPAQNFTVAAIRRKVFSRSNISLLFVNKQSVNYTPLKDSPLSQYSMYNRNIGAEYNLASSNNIWTGKLLFLKSFSPDKNTNPITNAGNLKYSSKRWLINAAYESVGSDFNAEVGYVPRKNYLKLNPQIAYTFFPKGGSVLTHGPQLNSIYFLNKKWEETDHKNSLTYLVTFRNKATLAALLMDDYVQVLFPFDPTNSGKDSLLFQSKYSWLTTGAEFISKPQSIFNYRLSAYYGGYYAGGTKYSVTSEIGYRFQPILNISLSASYNRLELPMPWSNTAFWLVGPKVDLTLTTKLFFTTYVQYNQQLNNTNVNARFQWRYKPASDLFIVYTDNYVVTPFAVRNRAILLKFTYWWNP